ncbi:MAG TPA: cyclase family protein [Solirubrobacteraceae bacterium]|nr:cyclase family protein [Solirubrobacteraceae bacterium]
MLPSEDDVRGWLAERRNWGRWGEEDQRGAFNLVTPETIVQAARLVQTGVRVSLARPLPTQPGPSNAYPVIHTMRSQDLSHPSGAGESGDTITATWHAPHMTHLDALCHVWDGDGMWNGRDPRAEIGLNGTRWGGIEQWREGFICRAILLDVPRHRGEPYVTQERPVHGDELREIAAASGIEPQPGDAIVVYSGLAAYEAANGPTRAELRPGLHASCMPVLREWDSAMLVWDMQDLTPSGYDAAAWSVHGVIYAYGMALVDAVVLEPLADECRRQQRDEFLLLVLPLYIQGGTGCAVNPVAVF